MRKPNDNFKNNNNDDNGVKILFIWLEIKVKCIVFSPKVIVSCYWGDHKVCLVFFHTMALVELTCLELHW